MILTLLIAVELSATPALPDRCRSPPPAELAAAERLMATLHPYDCCDDTVARCLAASPACPLAGRLAAEICRLVAAGRSAAEVERAITRRAQSMLPGAIAASFALEDAPLAGDPAAPVAVVVYACARCPFCRKLLPDLYREVVSGALRGKVRLYLRLFPIKEHEGAVDAALAILSAGRSSQGWPLLLKMYEQFEQRSPAAVAAWAEALGVEPQRFAAGLADPALRAALVAGKQEGTRNGVVATPTLFINGRRYLHDLEREVLVDLLLEEHERPTSPAARP